MKVNVKGLVFVGFAAAILSGAAARADVDTKKIVTSQAYTDATYQAKADKVTGAGEDTIANASDNTTKFTTPKAVVEYVGQQASANVFTAAGASTNGSTGIVPQPVAGKDDAYLRGDATWVDATTQASDITGLTAGSSDAAKDALTRAEDVKGALDTKVDANASITAATKTKITYDAKGLVTSGADLEASDLPAITDDAANDAGKVLVVGSDGKIAVGTASQTGTYQNKSTSGFSVGNASGGWDTMTTGTNTTVERVETGENTGIYNVKVNVAGIDAFTNVGQGTAADNAKIPQAIAVKNYADSKVASAITDNDTTHAPSGEAVHEALLLKQNAATAVTYDGTNPIGSATAPVYIGSDGVPVAVTVDSTPTNGSNNLVKSDGVYDAIHNLPASNIPAQESTICTDTTPCSLVAESTGAMHWRVMAVSASQTIAAGTCGDKFNTGCNENVSSLPNS